MGRPVWNPRIVGGGCIDHRFRGNVALLLRFFDTTRYAVSRFASDRRNNLVSARIRGWVSSHVAFRSATVRQM